MNNLQQLIEQQAAITAQNPALIPALVSTSISAPKPLKVYITKPPDFNGNDYNTFK